VIALKDKKIHFLLGIFKSKKIHVYLSQLGEYMSFWSNEKYGKQFKRGKVYITLNWLFLPCSRANKSEHVGRALNIVTKLGFVSWTCISLKNSKASWGCPYLLHNHGYSYLVLNLID